MNQRFRFAKFHTCFFTISEKAAGIFGEKNLHKMIESHFQGNWGEQDPTCNSRNNAALQSRVGSVISRFKLKEADHILVIESDLEDDFTVVAIEREKLLAPLS